MTSFFSMTRALVARKRKIFALFFALAASIGMSFAQNPGIVSSGTKGGMSYTFYDNGLLEISGSGALPGRAFTNWDGGFGASVKNIRFAEDCEVYGLDYLWFACYTQKSQLETIEINSVVPIMFSGTSGAGISYKQDGAVTITVTAPGIVDIENNIIRNYGSPVNMILNMPATTVFEKKWFSSLGNNFAVTIPTGAKGHIPAGYVFTDSYNQEEYDNLVADGYEDMFWNTHSDLVEGVHYTLGVESTFVITAENASQIFGQAAVSFQAPTQASNSEWVLWRKSDLKTFSDMSSGEQKVYKDVTVKVNNGVYNTDSGFGVHFESLGEDGVQFVAPEGKVFKRIVILNEYGTFSDPNWSYDKNYKKWSGSANTVGFVGNICGISLIEFELEASAPATPAYETVMNLINAIGEVAYTAECKAKIDAAREAYDALSDGDKEQVNNIITLTTAETAYKNLVLDAAQPAIAAIKAIPSPITSNLKLSAYEKVTAAREAYDALTDEEKAAIPEYLAILEEAEAAFAAIPSVGSETVITWDKNTGIEKMSGTTTSPAYEGITISIKGGGFGPENDMLRFNIAGLGLSFEFANTLGGNFQKIVISSTNAMPSTPLAGMGEGWAASNENKTATWTGDAATVKIWDGLTATSFWDVNTIQFTLGATVSATEAAQAAKDLIDAIGEVSYPGSKETIKAAREAVDALGANASLLDDADLQKLTQAEAAYAQLLAQAVAAVKDQIDALPATPLTDATKKLSEYNKVTDAREAYNALSDDEKAAVTNYDKLEAAEAAFAAIGGGSGSAPAGALNGAFTINADGDQIVFSKGNLQYQASTTTLRFATNQYDMIGADNANISDTYTGWIDLFGWGTGNRPAYSSTVDEDYSTFTDWGTNAISNGGNEANLWRTMTVQEWNHLIRNRTNAAHLQGHATVADVHGYVLLPDSWTLPAGLSFAASPKNWTTNVYTAEQWTQMEAAGAVFLPAAGYREPEIEGVGEKGWYWASNVYSDVAAYCFEFDETTSRVFGSRIYFGQPVRLVAVAATASPLADAQAALDKINAIPDPVVLSDECKAKIDAAREAVTALGENASLLDNADIDKLAKAEADFALLIKDATAVAGMIDAIGEVTFSADSKGKIVDAREAYEALLDELKPYVSNLDKLTAAEAAYEAARPFATVTTVPAAVEALQYTGAAQALITAGAAEHGTVLYSLDGENYSAELPTALLPGAYTIYYKVQATDDYKDVAPVTVIATIAYNYPATYGLFGIPEGWSVKVNDEEVAVVNGAVKNIAANDRFDIMPVKPEDVKKVEVVPYLLDLATVTDSVIYILDGDSITGTVNGHITVVIVPDAKVYFKDVNLTNTGSHPAVLCGGNAEIVVVGENTITCTKEDEYGIRAAGAGTTLTVSGDKTLLKATIDPNGGTVNQ